MTALVSSPELISSPARSHSQWQRPYNSQAIALLKLNIQRKQGFLGLWQKVRSLSDVYLCDFLKKFVVVKDIHTASSVLAISDIIQFASRQSLHF